MIIEQQFDLISSPIESDSTEFSKLLQDRDQGFNNGSLDQLIYQISNLEFFRDIVLDEQDEEQILNHFVYNCQIKSFKHNQILLSIVKGRVLASSVNYITQPDPTKEQPFRTITVEVIQDIKIFHQNDELFGYDLAAERNSRFQYRALTDGEYIFIKNEEFKKFAKRKFDLTARRHSQLLIHTYQDYLSFQSIQNLYYNCIIQRFQQNQQVFIEGEVSDYVYFILDGEFRIKKTHQVINQLYYGSTLEYEYDNQFVYENNDARYHQNEKIHQSILNQFSPQSNQIFKKIDIQTLVQGDMFGDFGTYFEKKRVYSVECQSVSALVMKIERKTYLDFFCFDTQLRNQSQILQSLQLKEKFIREAYNESVKQLYEFQDFIWENQDQHYLQINDEYGKNRNQLTQQFISDNDPDQKQFDENPEVYDIPKIQFKSLQRIKQTEKKDDSSIFQIEDNLLSERENLSSINKSLEFTKLDENEYNSNRQYKTERFYIQTDEDIKIPYQRGQTSLDFDSINNTNHNKSNNCQSLPEIFSAQKFNSNFEDAVNQLEVKKKYREALGQLRVGKAKSVATIKTESTPRSNLNQERSSVHSNYSKSTTYIPVNNTHFAINDNQSDSTIDMMNHQIVPNDVIIEQIEKSHNFISHLESQKLSLPELVKLNKDVFVQRPNTPGFLESLEKASRQNIFTEALQFHLQNDQEVNQQTSMVQIFNLKNLQAIISKKVYLKEFNKRLKPPVPSVNDLKRQYSQLHKQKNSIIFE